MEGKYLFTKSMVNVLRPLAEKLEFFSSECRKAHFNNILQSDIEDVCYPLLLLKDIEFKKEVQSLKVALRDFYSSIDLMKLQMKNEQQEDIFQNVLYCAYSVVDAKNRKEIRNTCALIESCELCFMKLVDIENENELVHHLQIFMGNVRLCLEQIRSRVCDLLNVKQQQQILLCINQISKSISLLISVFQYKRKSCYKNKLLNNYVSKRIKWCFLELKSAVEHPEFNCKDDKICGGQFVQKMDVALDVLSSCKERLFNTELKSAIDEVLCHAMSIAHVALNADFSHITESSQKVLKALEEVNQYYCSEENLPLKKLLIRSLSNALELLERQVNTALLKLVLEVFSDLFSPLKDLLLVCREKKREEKHNRLDLEEMITIFDLQMDRIMQIGLFAMTCSDDMKRVVGIKSCLASLESLEAELIPALLAHYQDPSNYGNLTYLKELVNHWKTEVCELKELIHNIVDPAAFCEVIVGDVQRMVATVKSNLQANSVTIVKHQIGAILKRVVLLSQQLKISLSDESACQISVEVLQHIQDFNFSCNELDAAYRLYLSHNVENITLEHKLRLLKRCELVVSLMKKVQPFILECLNLSSRDAQNTILKTTLVHKFGSTLRFPDSVKDLPVDADESKQESSGSNQVKITLENIMRQGKVMMKERSILYHTPRKSKDFHSKLQCFQPLDLPRLDSSLIINQSNVITEKTLGLDITAILDKLTFLSDTLTSKPGRSNSNEELTTCDLLQILCDSSNGIRSDNILTFNAQGENSNHLCLTKNQIMLSSGTLNKECSSSEIDTLERIDDLHAVEEKIASLQAHIN